jgi:hypothetical protein
MNIEEVREYALSLPGTTEDQAYGEDWVLYRIEGKKFPPFMAGSSRAFLRLETTSRARTDVARPL